MPRFFFKLCIAVPGIEPGDSAGPAEGAAGGGPGGRGRGIHRPQVSPLPETEYTVEEEREEKTKVVAALWDVLECRTSHLAAG